MTDDPRLASSDLQILIALLDGPMNGSAIKDEVTRRTDGGVTMGPGTLYTSIKRLLDASLIIENGFGNTQRERVYKITPRGRTAASAEARRLERIVSDARAKRLLPPSSTPRTAT